MQGIANGFSSTVSEAKLIAAFGYGALPDRKGETMELIFIGDHFYMESGTMMSSIYDISGNRQDWGFVQCALRKGESVHIRPATDAERKPYEGMLVKIKRDRALRDSGIAP